jgi:hypothetical protein
LSEEDGNVNVLSEFCGHSEVFTELVACVFYFKLGKENVGTAFCEV